MKMITATEANRDFSKLLERVTEGEAIGITKRGQLVATLNPATSVKNDVEDFKRMHLAQLRARTPIPGLNRGAREEIYED